MTSNRHMLSPPAAGSSRAWKQSAAWSSSTRSQLAARLARTWPPIRGSLTTCANSSRPPRWRVARKYDAGRFSFNVAKGRCETCSGEGFVCVELLFLPSVYSPCPTCHGARFNAQTLEVLYRGKNIADVLFLTVDAAAEFFAEDAPVARALQVLQEVGLGYLRLGQAATELSGGEAQRVKLATELQRAQRGDSLYVLDEPTTGLHPADVERLQRQLQNLVAAGNTVVVIEHDMQIIASSDWVIDMGPGAGDEGGQIVAAGPPATVARAKDSKTAQFLAARL